MQLYITPISGSKKNIFFGVFFSSLKKMELLKESIQVVFFFSVAQLTACHGPRMDIKVKGPVKVGSTGAAKNAM